MMDIESFVNGYEAAPLTKKWYRQSLVKFQKFLGKRNPTEETVEEFKLRLHQDGVSPSTICRHLSAIRTYFLWMKKRAPKDKRADFDLVVRGPKLQRKLPVYRTDENIQAMITASKNPFERALVMLLYDCALRIEELMHLDVRDIDFAGGYVKITRKGGLETRLPVSAETLAAVKQYAGHRKGKIFAEPYWKLHYELRRVANRVGLRNFTPHQLRHARACDLRAGGVSIEDIQEFLGHKEIQTTLIYARMMPSGLKKAIPAAF
jgi:site-specific recombinase XerD